MAFTATHLRHALDMADQAGVDSFEDLMWGSIYPDSRYLTGVDRKRTHKNPRWRMQNFISLSSFEKGIALHEFYDTQSKKKLSSLSRSAPGKLAAFTEKWKYQTALKFIEDQQSLDVLGDAVVSVLQDLTDLQRYRDSLITFYSGNVPYETRLRRLETSWPIPADVMEDVIRIMKSRSKKTHTTLRELYPWILQKTKDNNPLNDFV